MWKFKLPWIFLIPMYPSLILHVLYHPLCQHFNMVHWNRPSQYCFINCIPLSSFFKLSRDSFAASFNLTVSKSEKINCKLTLRLKLSFYLDIPWIYQTHDWNLPVHLSENDETSILFWSETIRSDNNQKSYIFAFKFAVIWKIANVSYETLRQNERI